MVLLLASPGRCRWGGGRPRAGPGCISTPTRTRGERPPTVGATVGLGGAGGGRHGAVLAALGAVWGPHLGGVALLWVLCCWPPPLVGVGASACPGLGTGGPGGCERVDCGPASTGVSGFRCMSRWTGLVCLTASSLAPCISVSSPVPACVVGAARPGSPTLVVGGVVACGRGPESGFGLQAGCVCHCTPELPVLQVLFSTPSPLWGSVRLVTYTTEPAG